MFKFAFLNDQNIVDAVTEWDGEGTWMAPNNRTVMIPYASQIEAGWKYVPMTGSFLEPAPQAEALDGIRRIEKIDFMRLFTTPETVRYKLLRMTVDSLTMADYAAAMAGDQQKLLLVSAGVMFDRFDLASQLELDHPETQQGIGLMGIAGIFGTVGTGPGEVTQEHVNERVAQLIAGVFPS
jgi:hypothetical protein